MPREVTILFGGSERLVPYVTDYLRCAAIGILMCVPLFVGMLVVRLDGSPNFAMMVNIINSLLNIGLDYLFVFPLEMGIKGAAIATSMASTVSALIMMGYFVFRSRQIRFYHPKFSHKAIRLTMRNAGYMVKRMFDSVPSPEDLILISVADRPVMAGDFKFSGDRDFLEERLNTYREMMDAPYVMGRDLIDAGFEPGEDFSEILEYAHKLRLAGIKKDEALKQVISFAEKIRRDRK